MFNLNFLKDKYKVSYIWPEIESEKMVDGVVEHVVEEKENKEKHYVGYQSSHKEFFF